MSNAVEVKQGRFVINSVWLTQEGEDFACWEVDTRSKYPDVAGYMGNRVLIWPGEGALHLNESTTEETAIILPEKYADWRIMAQGGRYEILITAWKVADSDSWETVYERNGDD